MVFSKDLPFTDLGFVQTDENIWVKYSEDRISVPMFVLTTTINPTSLTFLIKDLINNDMMSSNTYDAVKDFVLTKVRENKLKKLLD